MICRFKEEVCPENTLANSECIAPNDSNKQDHDGVVHSSMVVAISED